MEMEVIMTLYVAEIPGMFNYLVYSIRLRNIQVYMHTVDPSLEIGQVPICHCFARHSLH